ncbi:NYN domain-containing protein [Vibrio sp. ZSDZ34]|jgi:uncharacterized LabA/DUF88 family protein|uniref:NYN domain-containing protein n=1 Tax=Vibrio gelatinilyticus TaxID=2893468 RepID=A0A9X2AYU3_9VIBR|nr:NYN domain-containing protein [Vibrio gelatinilyticus]MCJ2377082.1 NYN domain-containing protein [Vibrio gelatinilyticus]
MKTAAIFVDVQNVYYTTRDAYGQHFNYNAFWQEVSSSYDVTCANAYAISSHNPKQRQFHHILRGIGFNVCLKPFIQRMDGSAKGDWDVGIALDVYEKASQVDTVILLSGDGDFQILVDRIRERFDVEVLVYGVEKLTANNLIEAATRFRKIDDSLLLW